MPDPQNSWIELRSADLSAEIDPLGAQLSSLRDQDGRDLLWNGDKSVWAGRAPILFPIVGTLAGGSYRLGSKTYPLSRHGFARGKRFEVTNAQPSTATFILRADDETGAVYPFRFELEVRYALNGPTLSLTAVVRNASREEMPASLGFHPGFRWPLPFGEPRASHFIQFEAEETAPLRRIDANGLMSPERHRSPIVRRRLSLTDELFKDDVLIFDQVRSRSVSYGAEQGPRIGVQFRDAPYLGLWTRPGAEFVCIEPWQGLTDPAGFSGDFFQKPGIFTVAPGGTHSLSVVITLL
jgi:galactose mutarotase-like enzyme